MKTYEPEWDLAEAAVAAAGLRMSEAADRAAWAAGVAADQQTWNLVLAGYHDAARYGAARHALPPMREAATHVDNPLAAGYVEHVAALADADPAALDAAAGRFQRLGMLLFAAEAAASAAAAHAAAGDVRAARASGQRSADYRAACEDAVSPWLSGSTAAVPLTARERQVAALAATGHSIGRSPPGCRSRSARCRPTSPTCTPNSASPVAPTSARTFAYIVAPRRRQATVTEGA